MMKTLAAVLLILLIALLVRQVNSGYELFITVGAALLLAVVSLGEIRQVVAQLTETATAVTGENGYYKLLLKLLGMTLTAQFVTELCRDSGESALASQTQLYAKSAMTVLLLPLVTEVLQIIVGLVK